MNDFILHQFIKYSGIPVVSLESATRHPLQSLADMITINEQVAEKRKPKVVLTHAVANSFSEWALGCGHDLTITHPIGYELHPSFVSGARVEYDQKKALQDADFVYVKNWSGFTDYGKIIHVDKSWLLTEEKLKDSPEAKVMHCLPVRRNLELSDDLLDSPRSLVQEQANNRIYAAQAVLDTILG